MRRADGMNRLLRRLTRYMKKASVGKGESFETSSKWFVVNPSDPPPESPPYESFEAAEKARMSPPKDCDKHTLGALTLMLDMSTGDGWNGTPVEEVHVVNKNTTVVGKRGTQPVWWAYPGDKYDTFVVVVPKEAKGKR